MNEPIKIGVLIVLTVTFFVLGVVLARKNEYPDLNSQDKCIKSNTPSSCKNDPKCCVIWNNNVCRKANIQGANCVSEGNVLPMILLILGFVFLAYLIVYSIVLLKR
jgi:hypothetical protein